MTNHVSEYIYIYIHTFAKVYVKQHLYRIFFLLLPLMSFRMKNIVVYTSIIIK